MTIGGSSVAWGKGCLGWGKGWLGEGVDGGGGVVSGDGKMLTCLILIIKAKMFTTLHFTSAGDP